MEGTPIIVKRKKAHAHAHHGGSWKVAYADFVTAMMAFFMVMWILGLSDEAKAQISGYFNDPMGYSKSPPLVRNIVKFPGVPVTGGAVKAQVKIAKQQKLTITYLYKKIRQAVAQLSKTGLQGEKGQIIDAKSLAKHLEITMTKEGLRIDFHEDASSVFFESGSAEIKPEARALIAKLAPMLAESGMPMKVEGHTDAVPYAGSGYDNWDLSGERANSMRRALKAANVKSTQFLSVSGYADTCLRDPNHPSSPINRRVSVLIPTADNGAEVDTALGRELSQNPDIVPEIDIRRTKPVQDLKKRPQRDALGFRKH